MTVYRGSRYTQASTYTLLSDEGIPTTLIGYREDVIESTSEDSLHRFVEGDRIDLLAQKYYGDAQLGWIILDANPQYMSELDISLGDFLRIPPITSIPEGVR